MLPRRMIVTATSRSTASLTHKIRGIVIPASLSSSAHRLCPTLLNNVNFQQRFSSSSPPPSLRQSNGEEVIDDNGDQPPQQRKQQQRQYQHPHRPTQQRQNQHQNQHQHQDRRDLQKNSDTIRGGSDMMRPTNKKWRHPFWLPPPSSSSSSSSSQTAIRQQPQQPQQQQRDPRSKNNRFLPKAQQFRDVRLPCRQHLDPDDSMGLPTSDWIQLFGALPMTSLEEVLESTEYILRNQLLTAAGGDGHRPDNKDGVIDLDAEWNPVQDNNGSIPLIPSLIDYPITDKPLEERGFALDKVIDGSKNNKNKNKNNGNGNGNGNDNNRDNTNENITQVVESFRVIRAHVVLSPFGRPTGWNLKLVNASMVNALLSAANDSRVRGSVRIGWKFAQVKEYHPPQSPIKNDPKDTRTMLVVNDTMVRFENFPSTLTEDHLRHMLSRYELTTNGQTIIKWIGMTDDGRVPPLTFVVRFASAAYARAAVREMQGKFLEGKSIKLIQFPKQLI